MSASVNQQISGLTVREGGRLFAGYNNNTTNNIYNAGLPRLLPYSIKAAFNASGKDEDLCLPNTRVNILNQIRAWIDGHNGSNIFWLSGWAGTGKSIIARTVSREYHDKGRQGENLFASFFFSRGEEDVSDAGKFVTTIAVQLATFSVLGERIHKAASDDDGIANKILHDQWRQLVIEPMSKIAIAPVRTTLVLVIDALDECDKKGDIWRVLQLLANAGTLQTVRLRVLITSRPETDIRHGFSKVLQGAYQEYIIHDISKSAVSNDIYIFFNHKFERTSLNDWPGEQAIKHLVQKAAGLFIWAATAYRFIHEGRPFHGQRLHLILQGNSNTTEPESELNKIYITVLKNSVRPNYNEQEKENFYKMLRRILGCIVLLFSPLSADSLASLINFPGKILRSMLGHLHSVLDVPKGQTYPIRLHHPSFRDFFLDTKRCTDRQLQVDGNKAHWDLANSCIRIMSAMLQKDICNLYLPGTPLAEIPNKKIEQCLPGELQYACIYWVQHLQESKNPLLDNGIVHLFLRKDFLFWLEALSLIKKISEGIVALISLENLVKVDQSPSLYAFIHDAKRFSLNFRYIIENAPLQIYSSALLFAPEMSVIRKEFIGQIPNWITGVIKGQKHWSPALQTLEGHSSLVNAVVFSPDSKLVASASYDKTVKLWDSSTGAALQTLKGHSDRVEDVVFSPDGKLIASASYDRTVSLWDSSTGAALQTLKGHSHLVKAVVFSPNGKLLASTSTENTIRLWDISTGVALQTLRPHFDSFIAAVFSPDGNLVASALHHHTIKLWGSSSGAALRTLEGHSDWVNAVVFSPDGKLVASASDDKTVRLWDLSTGAALQTLEGHSESVRAVVFSPDGKLVASASWDQTVRIWDSSTGAGLWTLQGHSHWVEVVVFSPDGKLVASASWDHTVRLWDSSTGAALQALKGHLGTVEDVVFSPDGKLIASASLDNTVRLWDSFTGAALQTPKGHSDPVNTAVFSPEDSLIASTSGNSMVRLKDSSTRAVLQTLQKHSDGVLAVVFSPDGNLVASASRDNTIRLWDSSTGAALESLEGHSSWVEAVVFSPDGKLIASASSDKTVRLWDLSTGAALQTLEHPGSVRAVVFSPDSRLVASTSRKVIRIWDSSTGASLQTLEAALEGSLTNLSAVVFSPDGRLVASASGDTVRIWDSSTGAALQTLKEYSSPVAALVFSPEGKLMVATSGDTRGRLRDSATGRVTQTFKIPTGISRLSFSQDGSFLETEKGLLSLQPASSDPYSPHQPGISHISLQDRWIVGTIGYLIWLPADFIASCSDVRGSSVVLGHKSGCVSFIRFDFSKMGHQSFENQAGGTTAA